MERNHFNYAIDLPVSSTFSSLVLLLTAWAQTILVRLPLIWGKKVATSTVALFAHMAAPETGKRRVWLKVNARLSALIFSRPLSTFDPIFAGVAP